MNNENKNLKRVCLIFGILIFGSSFLAASLITKDWISGIVLAILHVVLSVIFLFRANVAQTKDEHAEIIHLNDQIDNRETRIKSLEDEATFLREKLLDLEQKVRNANALEDLHMIQRQDLDHHLE